MARRRLRVGEAIGEAHPVERQLPDASLTAFLTYQYLKSDVRQYRQVFGPGGMPGGVASGPGAIAIADDLAVSDGTYRFQNQSHIVNLNVDWDLGPVRLAAIGAYQFSNLDQRYDLDAANAVPGYVQGAHVTNPTKVPTVELRLTSKDHGNFGWGLGAFYQHVTGTTVFDQVNSTFFAVAPYSANLNLPTSVRSLVPLDNSTWSFNANAHATLGNLTVEGGLRYSIIKAIRITDIQVNIAGFPGLPAGCVVPACTIAPIAPRTLTQVGVPVQYRDQISRPLTGGVTARYQLTPQITAYAAYGHSFRQGSVGVAVPVGVSSDLLLTRDEKTDSFEVGLKGSLLDRRVKFALTGFYQKFDGFLARFFGIRYNCPNLPASLGGACGTVPPATAINNLTDTPGTDGNFAFNYNGNAIAKGVELTLDARPTEFWDASVNMAYVKARYAAGARLPCNDYNGDGVPDTVGTPRITGTGNVSFCHLTRLSDTPDFSLTATTELRLPVSGPVKPFVNALLSYRPAVFSEKSSFDYPRRTLIDLHAGLRSDKGWELSAFVKNLLDQRRITDIQTGTIAARNGTFDPGYRLINTTLPREFGLSMNYHW